MTPSACQTECVPKRCMAEHIKPNEVQVVPAQAAWSSCRILHLGLPEEVGSGTVQFDILHLIEEHHGKKLLILLSELS